MGRKISDNKERGSSSFTVMAAASAAIGTIVYIGSMNRKSQNLLGEEKIRQASEIAEVGTMNSVSRFRAMLAPRKGSDGVYVPGLFASNYYDYVWNLSSNPQEQFEDMQKGSQGSVKIKGIGGKNLGLDKVDRIMEGKAAKNLSDTNSDIRVLKTNFSSNFRVAESVDVEIKVTKDGEKDQHTKRSFRIPVTAPSPYNPIVELSPAGANNFTSNFSSNLPSGSYDIRVLASGVVYDADIIVGGAKLATVGGFDKNGRITHGAVNPLAKNVEIGRYRYEFVAAEQDEGTGDNLLCTLVPALVKEGSGLTTFTVGAVVRGPNGNDVAKRPEVEVRFQAPPAPAALDAKSVNELADTCSDRCPFYGPRDHMALIDPTEEPVSRGEYGDFTHYHNMVENARLWGVKKSKLCFNVELSRSLFKIANGREPQNMTDFSTFANYYQFFTYNPKSCKRKFFFTRNTCGCFASDTKILLGDGKTEKPISELTENDSVWNPVFKKAFPIRKMTRGPEKVPLFKIVAGGQNLVVTGTHPFPNPAGEMRAAFGLSAGDQISLASGKFVKIESIETIAATSEVPVVWNLEVDAPNDDVDAHQVVANGLVTGDLVIQKQLGSKVAIKN